MIMLSMPKVTPGRALPTQLENNYVLRICSKLEVEGVHSTVYFFPCYDKSSNAYSVFLTVTCTISNESRYIAVVILCRC